MISGDVIDWYDNVTMARECLLKIHALVLAAEKFAPAPPESDPLGNEEVLQRLLIEAREFAGEWSEQFDEWAKELSPRIEDALPPGTEEHRERENG